MTKLEGKKAETSKFKKTEIADIETVEIEIANIETIDIEATKRITYMEQRLGREFFTRDGLIVAKELLGKVLVHNTSVGKVRGIITETEGYMGENDKGSHTYGGKRTNRTEPMYHVGGTSYVYLIYGMYYCMNIAAMTENIPQAVLIRKAVPMDMESRQRMELLRTKKTNVSIKTNNSIRTSTSIKTDLTKEQLTEENLAKDQLVKKQLAKEHSIKKHLADGPGKLCIAMEITKQENNIDMVTSNDFYVTEGIEVAESQILTGKRIGIDYAEEAADYLWRFYLDMK